MQIGTITTQQFDDSETDGIRPVRRTRGEHAVRPVVRWRRARQFKATGPVELPNDEQMRKAFDVQQARLILGKNLENSLCLVLRAKAFGNFVRVVVWTADVSNRARSEHGNRASNFHANADEVARLSCQAN